MRNQIVLNSFVILLGILLQSHMPGALDCPTNHPQQLLCDADIVLRGTVFQVLYSTGIYNIVYYINVQEVIRANEEYQAIWKLYQQNDWHVLSMYQCSNPDQCGSMLVNGTTYVLVGKQKWPSKLTIDACATLLLDGVEDIYNFQDYICKCKVRTEWREAAPKKQSHECLLFTDDPAFQCYDEHAYCEWDARTGECQWTQPKDWWRCVCKNGLW